MLNSEEIKHMYQHGESTHSIAKKLGVCPTTVKWHLKSAGVARRSKSEANKLAVDKGRIKIFSHTLPSSSTQLTKQKAYVLGVLCGDAWYWIGERSGQVGLQATDRDFVENFANCLERTYGIRPSMKVLAPRNPNWSKIFQTRLCSRAVINDIMRHGVNFKTAEWRVPPDIAKAPADIQAAFVKGYFDSEGHIEERRVKATSTNVVGLSEIQTLLARFGIRSSLILQIHPDTNRKPGFSLRVQDRKSVEKFCRLIGFSIARKQQALQKAITNYKLHTALREEVRALEAHIIQLRSQGLSYGQIAARTGLGIATVWNHININKCVNQIPRTRERIAP